MCPFGALLCVCGVLGHLVPVPWCVALCVVLLVQFPGRPGSCSPVCPLGALLCLCGVSGHLAPVHRCACSVCCVVCAVSWATWLLFTGVRARYVVSHVQCPRPLRSCSPVRSPGVLCGVLGHFAPVQRCAPSVCCAVGCVCRALLRGAHSCIRTAGTGNPPGAHLSIRTAAVCSRQGLGTFGAHTRPSGRWLFRSRHGLGSLPGAHMSVRTAACFAWDLSSGRGSMRVVRALRVCGTRRT